MTKNIKNTSIYIGPMTKAVVDGVIEYNNITDASVGLIASRRQIDNVGGYVNGWDTSHFVDYVKKKNSDILVCRDHGGINQGREEDDGFSSLEADAQCGMDIIHIDPWKAYNPDEAVDYTLEAISRCMVYSKDCLFEVGTEQSIYELTPFQMDRFLTALKASLGNDFNRIIYMVIQSGTSIKAGVNTGDYDEKKLIPMIEICKCHGVLSKEHNGDYLDPNQVKRKLILGLDAINIAPEIAHIETKHILNHISSQNKLKWFHLCLQDGQYAKWFVKGFVPEDNIEKVLYLCGHYVISDQRFKDIFDLTFIETRIIVDVCDFLLKRNLNNG